MPLVSAEVELSDDERILIETVRDFAQRELFPLDRKWDRDESTVAEVLPKLAEMGLMNLCLAEELSGLNCSYRTYAAILHEISVWSPSTAVTISVHTMVGNILSKFLPDTLRSEILPHWGDPSNFAAFAISEADAGSDPTRTATLATPTEGGYRINGEKMWITNGLTGRWFLTLVRMQGVPGNEGLCAVLIDGSEPGIERTEIEGKLGIRGSETAVIHFDNVFVPTDYVLGEPGQGMQVCLWTLNEGRIGIAAQATGIAEACLSEMTGYARQREQFGQPIGKFQAVANMIADSRVELEASKALVQLAANMIDTGSKDRTVSPMAKLYATEAANRIAYRAVQVHGATGFVNECRVEQLFRDARVTTIYEGTSEIQRLVIARHLGANRHG